LVSHIEDIKDTEDVREQDALENIQMYGGGSNRNSGETYIMRASKNFTPRHTPPVKAGEMSGICIKQGRGKICILKT
jgi:hypothetical protein